MHASTEAILKFFSYQHLPPKLQEISKPICELAHAMAHKLDGPELTAGLRKLLEAKDALVRASLALLVFFALLLPGCVSAATKTLAAQLAVEGPALEAEILAAAPNLPAGIKRDLHAYVSGAPLVAVGIGAPTATAQ